MHVLKQPLQESGKSCPFVQGAPGSTTSCVLFTPSLTPAGFFPLLRTWLSSSVPRLGWWIQERAQLPRIFPVPAAATRPSPAPSSTPTPGSRPTILLAKQNVLGSVFCWPDPGIPVPKTLLLARLLSPKSWSGSFFPWGQTFLWLLVPPASTQRTKHVAPSRRFHSWPSCCLQKPSGPALASGCFLPPQSLVSEKGGPWWRPGKPGSWWGRDPSVALAFLLSGTHTYNHFAERLQWSAYSVPGGVLPARWPWRWVLTSDTPRMTCWGHTSEHSWPSPVELCELPAWQWQLCLSRDDYQMIHWPKSIKCSKETIVSSPKALRMALFSLVLHKVSIDLYWAYGGLVAAVTRQTGAGQRKKDVPRFNQIQGTHLFFFFLAKANKPNSCLRPSLFFAWGLKEKVPPILDKSKKRPEVWRLHPPPDWGSWLRLPAQMSS